MATKSYLIDEIYSLKKQKQVQQNLSNIDEIIEQVNNGLVEGLKIKTKLLVNGNKSLRKKQDNNKKLLGTILDHNNSLLKNMNSPSKPTFLSEPPIGTANKTFTTKKFNNDRCQKLASERYLKLTK